MFSNAGLEPGEKELWLTEDKNQKTKQERISRRMEWPVSMLQRNPPRGLKKYPTDRAAEKSSWLLPIADVNRSQQLK